VFDLGVTYFSKLVVSSISAPRIMHHSLIYSSVLLVFVLLFNGCIRVLPKNEEKITFSNTIELEVSSSDWLFWRGPSGAGVSAEQGLPVDLSQSLLWETEIKGGGVPVVAGDRLYQFGYQGEKEDLREGLFCIDLQSGEILWERVRSDFLSDIVYDRYGVGAACIDAETGNVYYQTSAGLLLAYSPSGKLLWERSMMEEFSRLTFPNGRTGGPCVDEGLVILHAITANWGTNGPARDRFYAFDKTTGELVWTSTPGTTPKDSSFAPLIFEDLEEGRRVFYSGTGCGHVICIDARTGQPLWRFRMSHGGVNAGVVIHEDTVIAVHGKENIDSSRIGRMVAIRKPSTLPENGEPILVLDNDFEAWRNDEIESFTSSPVLYNNRVYTSVKTGELFCNDAHSGETHWKLKLAPDQIHASPIWADEKIYVPLFDGSVYVVEDHGDYAEILGKIQLDHACLASPSVAQGKIFIQAKNRLYCYGKQTSSSPFKPKLRKKAPSTKQITSLQIIPSEFAITAGEKIKFRVFGLDANGRRIKQLGDGLEWEKWVPPTVKVQAELDGNLSTEGAGSLFTLPSAKLSAGAIRVSYGELSTIARGRILPVLPYEENFESDYHFNQTATDGISFSYPPLSWLGARMRWQVQDLMGNKVAGNTLDRVLFQRAINFVGSWEDSDYVVEMDAMVDGNRRIKSTVGVINQRYIIALVGNSNQLQVVSNYDRFQRAVSFPIQPNQWYRLKTQIDLLDDEAGLIRAKAWPREEEEPDQWTLEVKHSRPHTQGASGIYALSPQSKKKVYFDNLKIYKKPE
jgi:outer membrane protein assembly factor BamB